MKNGTRDIPMQPRSALRFGGIDIQKWQRRVPVHPTSNTSTGSRALIMQPCFRHKAGLVQSARSSLLMDRIYMLTMTTTRGLFAVYCVTVAIPRSDLSGKIRIDFGTRSI